MATTGCAREGRQPTRARDPLCRVRTVKVVQHHTRNVEVEVVRWPSTTSDWVTALRDLTRRVETGRVYDRDLEGLAEAVNELVGAMVRRGRQR